MTSLASFLYQLASDLKNKVPDRQGGLLPQQYAGQQGARQTAARLCLYGCRVVRIVHLIPADYAFNEIQANRFRSLIGHLARTSIGVSATIVRQT